MIEYSADELLAVVQPFLAVMCAGFMIATILIILTYGIFKAINLVNM